MLNPGKSIKREAGTGIISKNLITDPDTGMEVRLVHYPAGVINVAHAHPCRSWHVRPGRNTGHSCGALWSWLFCLVSGRPSDGTWSIRRGRCDGTLHHEQAIRDSLPLITGSFQPRKKPCNTTSPNTSTLRSRIAMISIAEVFSSRSQLPQRRQPSADCTRSQKPAPRQPQVPGRNRREIAVRHAHRISEEDHLFCLGLQTSPAWFAARPLNFWHVTKPLLTSNFYTKDQRVILFDIFKGIFNPDWHENF